MNESDALLPQIPQTSVCSCCRKNISVDLIYVCTSGHDICAFCNIRLKRCLLCLKSISDLPLYFCKYQKYGCGLKAIYDEVRYHETDCDFKVLHCPFQNLGLGCNWYECEKNLRPHLTEVHSREIINCHFFEGEFPKSDKIWILVACDKVFKCYIWIYEFHVDWLLKYVGPQKYSGQYTYRLKLFRSENTILYKNSSKSTGYNNMSLEEGISIPIKDLKDYFSKGKIYFKLKIVRKKDSCNNSSSDIR